MKRHTTRRGFLAGNLAVGTGLLICGSRSALSYQANDRLNIACIGVAGMGWGDLGNVSSENIVALCDVHESRAANVWFPDPNRPRPDRVVIRIDGEGSEVDEEGYPRWLIVRFDLPARDELPPVRLTLYSGGKLPPADVLRGEPMTKWGALLTGPQGSIFSDCPWNTRYALLPKSKFSDDAGPDKTLPRGPGHHGEWIEACKGRGETFSSFAIGGPLTELIQLASIAATVNRPFEYDTLSGEISNQPEASRLLHREYREGWIL